MSDYKVMVNRATALKPMYFRHLYEFYHAMDFVVFLILLLWIFRHDMHKFQSSYPQISELAKSTKKVSTGVGYSHQRKAIIEKQNTKTRPFSRSVSATYEIDRFYVVQSSSRSIPT